MLKRFSFSHVEAPRWLWVNKIHRPFMQTIEPKTAEIPGRPGLIVVDRQTKEKTIDIEITIEARHDVELWERVEWVAAWLDQPGGAPLTFNDEPDRYYMAEFTGGSGAIEQIAATGKGTISFLIADPYKYGLHVNKDLGASDGIVTIANQGTAPIQPLYTVRFTGKSNYFTLVSPDGYIQLGQPAAIEEKPVEPEQLIVKDQMNDLAPWSASGINLDFGQASGSFFVESQSRFMVSDWGDSDTNKTAWHGPVMKRSLPAAIQDFRIVADLELYTDKTKPGRVEIWLLSATGAIQARLVLFDQHTTAEKITATVTAGPNGSNTPLFQNMEGPTANIWNKFKGRIVLRREGNYWRAYVVKLNQYGREDDSTRRQIYKTINDYLEPITQIQIGIRKYGTAPNPSGAIREITIEQLNKVAPEKQETPSLFRAGDILEIDTRSGNTWKNGEYYNGHLDPGSTFFEITPGTTDIQAVTTNPGSASINIDYDNRYK